jgi:hypothetical protein
VPTSSRWLGTEWITEVLALRASEEMCTARSAMPRVRLALPQPHLRDRER